MSLMYVFFYPDPQEKHLRQKKGSNTYIHSLKTLGQIPVLSGCCGTPELSKLHHNPSHGSGCSVKTQFTVRRLSVYWPEPHCGLNTHRRDLLNHLFCGSPGSSNTIVQWGKAVILLKTQSVKETFVSLTLVHVSVYPVGFRRISWASCHHREEMYFRNKCGTVTLCIQ